ncbi:hypothetical protein [Mycobacterium intracellulare]|uniref:hypothetical protein n=1 Tax=Mycobacterium intracellulare TaxID=1767 RepID=UPI0012DB4AB0|nr:hypothetical protein [Mycobacterium intracellulare]
MAPLLRIASLCIVSAHVMAPLLRIASLCIVSARVMSAAPPHRFALHRRRRAS